MSGESFSKIYHIGREWYHYYIFFSWAALLIFGNNFWKQSKIFTDKQNFIGLDRWLIFILILIDRFLQRTSGFILSYSLVHHAAMEILIDYLRENWENEHLPKVATTVNLMDGTYTVTTIIFAHIADSCMGRFKMVVTSTVMYITVSPRSILV